MPPKQLKTPVVEVILPGGPDVVSSVTDVAL
jgi:hypothetical protein